MNPRRLRWGISFAAAGLIQQNVILTEAEQAVLAQAGLQR